MTEAGQRALASTVEELRERIGRMRRGCPSIGEQNTKAALVNPLLAAIGWDLENIDEVFLEYRSHPQDNPVDYALFMLGKPCLFVEAKALGANLGDRRWLHQMFSYATIVGVEWCVLTNGDEYLLYNSHALVDADDKLFRRVRISNLDQHRDTIRTLELLSKQDLGDRRLNGLWKTQLVDRYVKRALQGLVWNRDPGLVRLIRKRATDLAPRDIRDALDRAHVRLEFSDVGLGALRADTMTRGAPSTAAPAVREPRIARAPTGRAPIVEPPAAQGAAGKPHWITLSHVIAAKLVGAPFEVEGVVDGRRLVAIVRSDGFVVLHGKAYASPTIAANVARGAAVGAPNGARPWRANGWTFWKYRDPETGKLEVVDTLRQRLVATRG